MRGRGGLAIKQNCWSCTAPSAGVSTGPALSQQEADAGLLKVNFDGVIFDDLRAAGIGVAVRNEHGEVVVALAEQIPIPDSVFTVETLAARRAVLFACDLGLHHVVF